MDSKDLAQDKRGMGMSALVRTGCQAFYIPAKQTKKQIPLYFVCVLRFFGKSEFKDGESNNMMEDIARQSSTPGYGMDTLFPVLTGEQSIN